MEGEIKRKISFICKKGKKYKKIEILKEFIDDDVTFDLTKEQNEKTEPDGNKTPIQN